MVKSKNRRLEVGSLKLEVGRRNKKSDVRSKK